MSSICHACKQPLPVAYTDELGRPHCLQCTLLLPLPSTTHAMVFLNSTIPYKVGDRVECWTAGQAYDGVGVVTDISLDIEHGGTPIYPAFRVELTTKAYDHAPDAAWYTEVCLKHAPDDKK